MSEQYILYAAVGVFAFMAIGIFLTLREFKEEMKQRAAAEKDKNTR
jgi:hypothetical protein